MWYDEHLSMRGAPKFMIRMSADYLTNTALGALCWNPILFYLHIWNDWIRWTQRARQDWNSERHFRSASRRVAVSQSSSVVGANAFAFGEGASSSWEFERIPHCIGIHWGPLVRSAFCSNKLNLQAGWPYIRVITQYSWFWLGQAKNNWPYIPSERTLHPWTFQAGSTQLQNGHSLGRSSATLIPKHG